MTILEVFSCAGGMAEGLRRAGLHVSMAFDRDPDACASYAANLGHRPVQMDARDLLRMVQSGWSPGHVELLVCDPPCTPWSRAGKRKGQDDARDMLGPTVELVRLLRPRAFLIANVTGLDDGPNWPTVQKTIGSLGVSYCIDFARLDAASYGVPQHRVRPFWYGHDRERPHLAWPERTHGAPDECRNVAVPGTRALVPWVTCREALGHLAAKDLGSPVRLRWRGCKGNVLASVPDRPARVVGTSNLSDGNVLAHPDEAKRKGGTPGWKPRASSIDEPAHVLTTRDSSGDGATLMFDGPAHRPSRLDRPARTVTRNTHGDGALLQHPRQPGKRGAVLAWPWDAPSTVVSTRAGLAEPGHHVRSNMSTPNAIKLSEKAAAILQGFPEGWHFAGATKRARWSQIGQAMPPPLAEAVGRSIARNLAL